MAHQSGETGEETAKSTEKPEKPSVKIEFINVKDPNWLLSKTQPCSIYTLISHGKQNQLTEDEKMMFDKLKHMSYKPLLKEQEDFRKQFTRWNSESREEPVLALIKKLMANAPYDNDSSQQSSNDIHYALSLLKTTFCIGPRPEDGFVLNMKSFEATCAAHVWGQHCDKSQRLVIVEYIDTKGLLSAYKLISKCSAKEKEETRRERRDARNLYLRIPCVEDIVRRLYSEHDPCIVFDMCDEMKKTGDLRKSGNGRIRTIALFLFQSIFRQPDWDHRFVLSLRLFENKVSKFNTTSLRQTRSMTVNRTNARKPEDDIPGTSSQFTTCAKKRKISSQKISIHNNTESDYDADTSFLSVNGEGSSTSVKVEEPDYSIHEINDDLNDTTGYNITNSFDICEIEILERKHDAQVLFIWESGLIERLWISVYDLICAEEQTTVMVWMREKAKQLNYNFYSEEIREIFDDLKIKTDYLVVLEFVAIIQSGKKQQENSLAMKRQPEAAKIAVCLMKSTFRQGFEPEDKFVLIKKIFRSSLEIEISSILPAFLSKKFPPGIFPPY